VASPQDDECLKGGKPAPSGLNSVPTRSGCEIEVPAVETAVLTMPRAFSRTG
jgi:hypothetical protein